MPNYAAIIQREFAKAISCDANAVHVDMSEDELIRVDYDGDTFECDCDDDENFVFVCTTTSNWLIMFPIPADYLEN